MSVARLHLGAVAKRAGVSFGLGLLLAACLFGGAPGLMASRWLGPIRQEVLATFRDPGTQWMVFACCGVYFTTFMLLQHRATGAAFWRWSNPDVWLAAALAVAAVRYAFGYGERAGGTEALVLLGGAAVGKGMAWLGGREHRTSNIQHSTSKAAAAGNLWQADRKIEDKQMDFSVTHFPVILPGLLGLLVLAVFWRNEAGRQFQYREQARWSGPWENPNGFGMLMGVGLVLAIGLVVSSFRFQGSGLGVASVVRGPWSVVPGEEGEAGCWMLDTGSKFRRWLRLSLFAAAAGILGFGLMKSYSRGAWLGTVVGLGFLAWGCWACGIRGIRERGREEEGRQRSGSANAECGMQDARTGMGNTHLTPALSPHPMGGEGGALSRDSRGFLWLSRNWMPLAVIVFSVAVLAFWSFRHTEQVVARRAFSVGNVNDFSWRNRVAAWVGAMQMMAERPLAGHGWNRVERVYDQYYRAPNVQEGMAIQLNDYLTLGATLGIPALVCFLGYVGLSLVSRQWSVVGSPGTKAADYQLLTTDVAKLTCHAGALVLLIAFWFDGGLFRLATATVFWVLLELGRRERARE